jgi:Zn-dependent membrane protease YugP
MIFDPLYLVLMAPAFFLALAAQILVKWTFSKYSHVTTARGISGAQAAKAMLAGKGIHDVSIEPVQGMLSDHYDPRTKSLRLSREVYSSASLSAVGVACHEAGHAIQHAVGYRMLALRSALVPVTQFGSSASYLFIIAGFILNAANLIAFGAILFTAVVLFSLITLPVEWDASRRAKLAMVETGLVTPEESVHAGKVLNAAFLTYVASAVSAILTLLYYLVRAGVLGERRD